MNTIPRMRAAFRALLVAAALLMAAAPLSAQSARVLGRVTDGAGNAVPGARVSLVAADGTAQATTSGRGGGFEFPRLPAGTYTLRADASPRNGAREQRITVQPGQVASPVVRLPGGASPRVRPDSARRGG